MKKMKVVFATIALVGALAFTSCANPSGGGSSSKSSNSNSVTNTESSSGSDASKPNPKPEDGNDASKPDSKPEGGSDASKPDPKPEDSNDASKPNLKPEGGNDASNPNPKPEVPAVTIEDFCGDWTYSEGKNVINISINPEQMTFTSNMVSGGNGRVILENNNILHTDFNGMDATAEFDGNKEKLKVTSDFFMRYNLFYRNVIFMTKGRTDIPPFMLEPGVYMGMNGERIEFKDERSGVYYGAGIQEPFTYDKGVGMFVMQNGCVEQIFVEQDMPGSMSFTFRGNKFRKQGEITYTDNNGIRIIMNGNMGRFELKNPKVIPFELRGSDICVCLNENGSPSVLPIGKVLRNDGKSFNANIDRNNFELVVKQDGNPVPGNNGQIKVEQVNLPKEINAANMNYQMH